jgi:hypothetical protein
MYASLYERASQHALNTSGPVPGVGMIM